MVIMKTKRFKKTFKFQKPTRKFAVNEKKTTNEKAEGEVVPKEIRIIAQEVQMVRSLACNDINKRNKQIRKLRKWMQLRARSTFPITEEGFLRIWKGLYYNMWLSDKPLVQEDLAEQLGKLIECFEGDVSNSVKFFGAFMQTMCNEWFGIDQWRMDKFMMLVRRMLRHMFRVLKRNDWKKEDVQLFNENMKLTVLANQSPAIGLTMHYLDIFFEELAKVTEGEISAELVGEFVRPFVTYLAMGRDPKLISHCRIRVLQHLLFQSTLGREYTEKFNAWKEMGFPTTSIQDLERVEDDGNEDEAETDGETERMGKIQNKEKHLDPRAGDVDVLMPELPLDAKHVIDELERLLYKNDELTTKVRKSLRKQLNIFKIYQQGEFPLGVKRMPRFQAKTDKPLMKEKIEQLENVENELFAVGRKLKQLNKRKRRKFLKSINFTEVDESNFDQTILKALPKQYLQERKRKATAVMNAWVEEEIDTDVFPKKKQKQKTKLDISKKLEEKVAPVNRNEKEHKQKKGKPDFEGKTATETTKEAEEKIAKKIKSNKAERTNPSEKSELNLNNKPEDIETKKSLDKQGNKAKLSWETPLAEGEIEYFIPSRKIQLRNANTSLVRNPMVGNATTPISVKKAQSFSSTPNTGSAKRVKIALKRNTSQNPSEYIRQIKSSPNVPYDADKKPGKGLLKPNSMPSPINPFYKKKIGLRLANDTL
ncbi:ribosomal RNA processing protein 1 homolog [Eurosta solidaginis]|uniref:ribosomal RNA processing protein 1 homolog n=1 Tax=Eurosta solidaginis TaxID=178769 RepID=UPI0035305E50